MDYGNLQLTSSQVIFKSKDPYSPKSWHNAVHFDFVGYDPEPFWDVDGKAYIVGAHAWQVGYVLLAVSLTRLVLTLFRPYIQKAEVNLDTGAVGEWDIIWNGTGGLVGHIPLFWCAVG